MEAFMDLKTMTNVELTNRLDKLVRTERKITHLILEHIVEFESRKLYAEYGCGNMFSYLTKKLGYGEDSAYRRLQAARVLRRIPEAAIKIESGVLNLSQLAQVERCLKVEKKQGQVKSAHETQEILEKLENCSGYETKKILAIEFNQSIQVQTRICPQKDDSVRLEITLTQKQFEELKTAQSLLSHICPSADLGEIIATLAQKFNQLKLGKENSLQVVKPTTQSFMGARKSKRKYISVKIKRSLLRKSNNSCEHTSSSGARCGSQFQLQIDHVNPVALGGSNSVENLRVLCRTHNNYEARRLGLEKV